MLSTCRCAALSAALISGSRFFGSASLLDAAASSSSLRLDLRKVPGAGAASPRLRRIRRQRGFGVR